MKQIIFLLSLVMISCSSLAQNVGIGTSAPQGRLDIRHTSSLASPTLNLYDSNTNNFSRIQLQNAGGSTFWQIAGYVDHAVVANSRLNFYHNVSGDILSMAGNGNIGLGTAQPLSKFHIFKGSSGFAGSYPNRELFIESNDHSFINMMVPENKESGLLFGKPSGSASGGLVYGTGNDFQFRTNGNITRMLIGSNGNVGIGNNSPGEKLEVNGNIKAQSLVYTSPKTLVYSLGGADFRAVNSAQAFSVMNTLPGVYMSGSTFGGVVAPLHLPHGAVITLFQVYYYDNSTENLIVSLFSSDEIGIGSNMASVLTSGTPGNGLLAINSITTPVINNTSNYYYVHANGTTGSWSGPLLRLSRVVINYTVSEPD